MKKTIFLFVSSIVIWGHAHSQPLVNRLVPKIDKRVELLSIVFRMAAVQGFRDSLNPRYSKAIDQHFNKYVGHPLIKYVSSFTDSLDKKNIEYGDWSVEALAVHLSEVPKLEPVVAINDTSNMDGWEDRTFFNATMVRLVQQFYKDAKCSDFFASQEQYYTLIRNECEKQVVKINESWLSDFFAIPPSENYYPILCLCMRNGAYARVNFSHNKRNTYTFYECKGFDKNGVPNGLKQQYLPRMMLHESVHTFTNQLVDNNIEALRSSAEIMLANPRVANKVKNTFYDNWPYLLYESLVKAASIKYISHNKAIKISASEETAAQEKAGFFWIRGLVQLLDKYGNNKHVYKNVKALMPEIIDYFRNVAKAMNEGKYVFPPGI